MKLTTEEWIAFYEANYNKITPTKDSVNLVNELWDSWGSEGLERPNVKKIVSNVHKRNRLFFDELLQQCSTYAETPKGNIALLELELYHYNYGKFPTEDGCLILSDEAFDRLLFVLAMGGMHVARETGGEQRSVELKKWMHRVVFDWYIEKKEFPLPRGGMEHVLALDYETSVMGVFLANALKSFILSHEIGHQALGHADDRMMTVPLHASYEQDGIKINVQSHQEEFEADLYALKVYSNLHRIKDGSNPLCFLWWYPFAPLLLMDIFSALEIAEKGSEKASSSHPSPTVRKRTIQENADLGADDGLYLDLKDIMNEIMSPDFN